MANKDYNPAQIVAALRAGGSTSGQNPLRVLLALAANPSAYAQLVGQSGAELASSGLSQFDPNAEYDPSAINSVSVRYSMMPEKYQQFIADWFATVQKYGGMTSAVSAARRNFRENEQYGLTVDERDSLLNDLVKDTPKYLNAETQKQKKQYTAFLKQRKAKGITSGDPTAATSEYLQKITGVKGLPSDLPTSIEMLAKAKGEEYKQKLMQGKLPMSEKRASEMAAKFMSEFSVKAKEKKVNPMLFGMKSLVYKNLFGG
jgi:hypothetical protein